MSLDKLGYTWLIALLLVLPFDPFDYSAFVIDGAHATPVFLIFVSGTPLALVTVARDWRRREPHSRRRLLLTLPLLLALIVSSTFSALLSAQPSAATIWIAELAAGGAIILALPSWIRPDARRRVPGMAGALVLGATVDALIGFAEYFFRDQVKSLLLPFRPGPTTMGPFLRLTSTFRHANIAAMYLELTLCFAVAGFIWSCRQPVGANRWYAISRRLAWAAAINVLLLALALTFSRGAIFGLGGALGVVLLFGDARGLVPLVRRRSVWLALVGSGAVLAVFFSSVSNIEALRLSGASDQSLYRATFLGSPPEHMSAGGRATVAVTVRNDSPLTWTSPHRGDYALSYHWLEPSLRIARFDTTLADLPLSVRPGASASVVADVVAPSVPGKYVLIWDLFWRHATWFDLRTGSLTLHPVTVAGPVSTEPLPPGAFSQPGDSSLLYLPISDPQSRSTVWRVAWHAFLLRPLIGGGIHAIRALYASYENLPPNAAVPSHAHNLVLELLDSWGAIGTVLLVGLTGIFWGPLIAAAFRRQAISEWQLACLAAGTAFLVHGMVDYFLGTVSIFAAVVTISGLASASAGAETRPSVIPNNNNTAREPNK